VGLIGKDRQVTGTAKASRRWPRFSQASCEYAFDFNWEDKLEHHVQPLSDYTDLSVPKEVQDLLEINANALQVFCMSISGYMFYDSKVGVRHPTLRYDYTKEMVRLGHERGIAMELYIPTMWADYLIQQHSEWGMRNPDGTLYTAAYGGYHPDLNSPALEWYVQMIHELVPAYQGDALLADGTSFMKYGQSKYTVSKFQQDMGRAYPTSLESDPDWRATLRWEIKQLDHIWQTLRAAAKEGDPHIEVTFNGPGPDIRMPGRIGRRNFIPVPPHLCQQADYASVETGETGEYIDWTRGISHPLPFRIILGKSPFSILDPFDPNIMRARIGRTMAVGGMLFRYDRTSVNGEPSRHFLDHWGALYKEVHEKMFYVEGAEVLKYVGVVSSEPTMYYRGRSDDGCHADDLLGALRMLDALHIQHEVIADWNLKLEFLKPYGLIVLPNMACMSDEQAGALRQYVSEGGTVLATAETSLLNPEGNPRKDFALSEVFGVQIDETPSTVVQTEDTKKPVYIDPSNSSHAILRPLPHTALIIPGDSVYVRVPKGQPTAALIRDAGTPKNSPDGVTGWAGLHVNEFGRGKSMYICGSIFARSAWRPGGVGVRWAGQLVTEAVRYLAPEAPYTLRGPEEICAVLTAQPARNRHVLHLVNWVPDLPAHDVEIEIAGSLGIRQTATMVWPTRQRLVVRTAGGLRVYTIPEVGPHVMVVFE
jgi:hypothetical protein